MIMQQINLYPDSKNKSKFNLQCDHILKAMLGLCIILSTITIYDIGEAMIKYIEVKSIESKKRSLQSSLSETEKLFSKSEQEILATAVKRLEEETSAYQQLLGSLKSTQQPCNKGFELYLRALSQQAVPGVWLTRFSITGGGQSISLEGNALHAGEVTKLMHGLGNEPIFQGKTFQLFTMEADEEKKFLKFNINTDEKDEVPAENK